MPASAAFPFPVMLRVGRTTVGAALVAARRSIWVPSPFPAHGGRTPESDPGLPGPCRSTSPVSSDACGTGSKPAPALCRRPPSGVFYFINGDAAEPAQPLHRPAEILDLARQQHGLHRLGRGGSAVLLLHFLELLAAYLERRPAGYPALGRPPPNPGCFLPFRRAAPSA